MFQLSKATEYGVLLLSSLEEGGFPVSLAQVAREKKLPLKYLERVAVKLRKAGILESKQGVTGGYFLAKGACKMSLADVVKVLESDVGLVSCIYGRCGMEKECSHRNVLLRLQRIINNEMKKIKLSEVIR